MTERRIPRWTPGTKFAMRQFIFEFEQPHALELGMELADLLILDYFLKFFQEGRAKMILHEKKRYFLIRYSKILEDLPILRMSDKTLRRKMAELERKQILSRYVKGKRDLYVCVDWDKVFGRDKDDEQNCPAIVNIEGQNDQQGERVLDNDDQPPRRERAAIESYNINKIKIITNARVSERDKDLILREILKRLKESMHITSYELWFEKMQITDTADTFVEFGFYSKMAYDTIKKNDCYFESLERVTQTVVKLFNK